MKRRDEQERDEFAERMRAKDKAASKSRNHRNHANPAPPIEDARSHRLKSREDYLAKRQVQELELLKKQIEIDQEMWISERLTRREMREIRQRAEIYRIALERQNIDNGNDGYVMPDQYFTKEGKIDKKRLQEVLTKRTHDRQQEKYTTNTEQWEERQARLATSKIPPSRPSRADEYEYVFDETQNISFALDNTLPASPDECRLENILKDAERRVASIDAVRKSLPVYAYREQLLRTIRQNSVVIVTGETGSGKTTQIPQYLYESGFAKQGKIIGCTQPRRVATMSVAKRVSTEMGKKLGEEVGFQVRFEDCTDPTKTKIKYMTDGMLLRQLLSEPNLESYSVLMIDEAHERNLATDILLGLLRDISRWGTDLKVIISSATLDAQKFSDFFDGAPIIAVPGRRYPIDIYYAEGPESNYIQGVYTTVFQIHRTQPDGDILVFLTGQEEIETCAEMLANTCRKLGSSIKEMIITPMYANLLPDLQCRIFETTPRNARKVILSTNIAESSITVDQVKYVIDCGLVKENNFCPRRGIESLDIVVISKASAKQRAGRAGRTGPGKCFRLYTKHAYETELPDSTTPEIQRVNMANTVLTLKSLQIDDVRNFSYLDAPTPFALIEALNLLYGLGALRDDSALTKLGREIAELPLEPKASKSIIAAGKLGCAQEMISIQAMLLEGGALFYRPRQHAKEADARHAYFARDGQGDHIALLKIWNEFVEAGYSHSWARENYLNPRALRRVLDVRNQLLRLCERIDVELTSSNDVVTIKKAITAGYFFNVGKLDRNGESYHVAKNGGQQLYIHPGSSLFHVKPLPRYILYHELVLTSKEYARNVMQIEPAWFWEAAPHYYEPTASEKRALQKGKENI